MDMIFGRFERKLCLTPIGRELERREVRVEHGVVKASELGVEVGAVGREKATE